MKNYIKFALVYLLYHSLYFTWRVSYVESEEFKEDLKNKNSYLLSMWHGSELSVLFIPYRYKLAALVSQSKDGQLMTDVLQAMGVKIARGSSSKGAVSGFKALIKLVKTGLGCIFAVDGPKGPYRKIKPGLFEMARLSRSKIYPLGVSVSSYWMSKKSWNKAILPKPFAKIVIVVGDSYKYDLKNTDPRSTDLSNELSLLMHGAEQESLHLLAHK